ncbi:MAG: hypothetical protein K2O84_00125 [Oscillospiraceae bacterium]|nr:hypothetical protein [Oscillospiraceae bacterium]
MAKPITGCIIMGHMSAARAETLIRFLQESRLKQEGLVGEISVRERRPGDTTDMLQSISGIMRNTAETAS